MKRSTALLLTCSLAACSSSSDVALTGWPFDPVEFFTGHTHGQATLKLITGASRHVSVDSHGRFDGKGGLVLDQLINEQGSRPRMRRWTLHPAGADRWTGTLTDAAGPVVVQRTKSDVTIEYTMHNRARVEQHLQLPPGGIADNHLSVSRFGLKLATLDERIRKLSR